MARRVPALDDSPVANSCQSECGFVKDRARNNGFQLNRWTARTGWFRFAARRAFLWHKCVSVPIL